MFPILLSFGPIKIYSFGIFLALAAIVGAFIIWREGCRSKFDEEKLVDLILYVAIFGLIGARIYYVVFHFGDFSTLSPFYWLLIFHFPGLSFLGAILGGLLGLWLFAKKERWSFWETGDFVVLGLSLGEAIGRLGAFFSGSAYGAPTTLPWGVAMVGIIGRRHPSQIYESLAALFIFLILLKLKKTFEAKKLPSGLILLSYFFLFGLTRFFLEFFRGEVVYLGVWRVTQLVSLIFIASSLIFSYRRLGRSPKNDIVLIVQKLKNIKKKGTVNV